MREFKRISKYEYDEDVKLPVRSTGKSAGYDLFAAEDILVPSYWYNLSQLFDETWDKEYTLEESAEEIKKHSLKPTFVPTGVKVYLEDDEELELRSRSSVATKNLLTLANGVGTIDADYVDNEDNEGHIMVALFNISPYNIKIKKGDKIAQGLIHKYIVADGDEATAQRTGGFGSTGVQ